MKRLLPILFLFTGVTAHSQCDWENIFPFKAGDTKFDIAILKNGNHNLEDADDFNNLKYIIDQANNRYVTYSYLKDSVYRNIKNLQYKKDQCLDSKENSIQITSVNDHLYRVEIELKYTDYEMMLKQYSKLLDIAPLIYQYQVPIRISNTVTKEKVGEGIRFIEKSMDSRPEKVNELNIKYIIDFKRLKNLKKTFTNEIEGYTLSIYFVDLRNTVLKREGF